MPCPSAGAAGWRTRRCGALGSLPTCSYQPDRDSSGGPAWSPRYLRPSCAKESYCMPHESELVAMMLTDRIEINPKVMMGKPVIRGTRITVDLILRKLA